MSATTYGTKGNTTAKSEKEILAELKKRTDRMKRPNPTKLELPNGEQHRLDDDFLERLAEGVDFDVQDWFTLGGILVTKCSPSFSMLFGELDRDCMGFLRLAEGQQLFRISFASTQKTNGTRTMKMAWYIQKFEGPSNKVKMYTVRRLYSDFHEDISDLEWLVGGDSWKLSVETHNVCVRSLAIVTAVKH
jgi:hypothetical protein